MGQIFKKNPAAQMPHSTGSKTEIELVFTLER